MIRTILILSIIPLIIYIIYFFDRDFEYPRAQKYKFYKSAISNVINAKYFVGYFLFIPIYVWDEFSGGYYYYRRHYKSIQEAKESLDFRYHQNPDFKEKLNRVYE